MTIEPSAPPAEVHGEDLSPWTVLYAAALATDYVYDVEDEGARDVADGLFEQALEVERWAVQEIAGDRGAVTLERWARAARLVLRARVHLCETRHGRGRGQHDGCARARRCLDLVERRYFGARAEDGP